VQAFRRIASGEFNELSNEISGFSAPSLVDELLKMKALSDILDRGAVCLEIGCNAGHLTAAFATVHPQSVFVGMDSSEDAINSALNTHSLLGNVGFIVGCASSLPADWTNRFDLVIACDVIHELSLPNEALAEVLRVLKPGGRFSMIEPKSYGSPKRNQAEFGCDASAGLYVSSLLHCLPVAMPPKSESGLGSMWGTLRAKNLLTDSGFHDIQTVTLTDSSFVHFWCRTAAL
jgi:SAM-dependent methyltransferase